MDVNESTTVSSPVEAGGSSAWKWVGLGLGVALVLVLGIRWATGGAKQAPPVRSVPVATALVRVGDMPVNLTGLGTVVPTEAVTIRTRVDGQIMKVFFREGQFVKEGEVLLQIDPRPFQVQLLQAEGQLAKDQAALKNAQLDLQRFKSLVAQKILPQQQLDTQSALVDQDAAAVKSDTASVESAKLNLTYSRITAPVSGKVGLRLVDPGNMVHATDATGLVTVTPVSPIDVLFTLPADDISMVLDSTRGGKTPPVEVYDRDMKNRLTTGSFLAVDNQVDTATGTVKIKAVFPNRNNELFPNQFVNARLLVDTLRNAVLVPAAAIQRSPQGSFVYVVKPDATVDLCMVEIQVTDGETTALHGGLKGGERVVVSGLDKLRPGSKVTDTSAAPKAAK